jgi:tetratricopeptide (TPR) repeat protein
MVRLDREVDNLRAALDYAIALDNLELELRLAGALWRYWWVRGHLAEGRTRIEAVLSRAANRPPAEYSDVLLGAGILAWCVGDYARGRAAGGQLLEIAAASESLVDEHAGNKVLGMVALRERRYDESERYARRTVELARALGNELDIVLDRLNLAVLIMDSGRIEEAIPIFEEGLDFYRRTDNAEGAGLANLNLGEARYLLGDDDSAGEHFEAARAAFSAIGFRAHVGHALRGLAGVAARQSRHGAAANLLGRAEAVMGTVGASEDDFAPGIAREAEALARAALGELGFTRAFEEGQREPARFSTGREA